MPGFRVSADGHRLAAQLRAALHLDRRVEAVGISVQNTSIQSQHTPLPESVSEHGFDYHNRTKVLESQAVFVGKQNRGCYGIGECAILYVGHGCSSNVYGVCF